MTDRHLRFEENVGQGPSGATFVARGAGYRLYASAGEVAFVKTGEPMAAAETLRLRFSRGSHPLPRGEDRLPGVVNYFLGNAPGSWHTQVPTYGRLLYPQVYPGIDAAVYGIDGHLEYDFIVSPRGNPADIRFALGGATDVRLTDAGDLQAKVGRGEVRVSKPVLYQEAAGTRYPVEGRFVQRDEGLIGVDVAGYDGSRPLVIDPVVVYSTFLGTDANDIGTAMTLDADRNAYVTGYSVSMIANRADAFVAKLDAGGQLLYSTYLGGSFGANGNDIAVDASGRPCVVGHTLSADFPVVNALQPALTGVQSAFVTCLGANGDTIEFSTYFSGGSGSIGTGIALDAAGHIYLVGAGAFPTRNSLPGHVGGAFLSRIAPGPVLQYSTRLGGTGGEFANDVAIDRDGHAYVVGYTYSSDFPHRHPVQGSYGGGLTDAFVAKIASIETTNQIFDDSFDGENGGTAAAPYTTFADWRVVSGSVNLVYGPAATDGAVQGSGTGSSSIESIATFDLAHSSSMFPAAHPTKYRLEIDLAAAPEAGRVRVQLGDLLDDSLGADTSPSIVIREFVARTAVTAPLVLSWGAGEPAAIVSGVRLVELGGRPSLEYSTFLGGTGLEQASGVAVDAAGVAHITGTTSSSSFPLVGAFQTAFGGGDADGFVARLSADGSTLLFSTLVGGTANDEAASIAATPDGHSIVSGGTGSPDFPVADPVQPVNAGATDAFVFDINPAGDLVFSTFLGGNRFDHAARVAVDAAGFAYVAGQTSSADFPALNAFQPALISPNDAFVTKLSRDTTAPTVTCAAADGAWHAANVSLPCAAADTGSGLQHADDASFSLVTSVADGEETANALTDTRTVCDRAGNCATAGPVAGSMIDRKIPAIAISSPTGSYTLNQPEAAAYACADQGSSIASCAGPVPSGALFTTAAAGVHTFTVAATDGAGNIASKRVSYAVSYGICVDFDQTRSHPAGSTLPIKLRLCDAAGVNVSGPDVTLTALDVLQVSGNAPGPLDDAGHANPDLDFRHAGDAYIFNLSLKGLGTGTFALVFRATGDPTSHRVLFQVK
jgi:hypothetical protein